MKGTELVAFVASLTCFPARPKMTVKCLTRNP